VSELQPEDRVGRYVVGEVLGRGGMGVVYAAHDPELDREIAIAPARTHTLLDQAVEGYRQAGAMGSKHLAVLEAWRAPAGRRPGGRR
jgi:hypothetical protein